MIESTHDQIIQFTHDPKMTKHQQLSHGALTGPKTCSPSVLAECIVPTLTLAIRLYIQEGIFTHVVSG